MYSSLRVSSPPANLPVTVEEARHHLRVDHAADDDLIRGLIVAASMMAEQWINRALITQTLVWTMSQDPPTGALPLLPMPLLVLPVILTAPQVMNKPLELPRSPVQSVSSVVQVDLDGTSTTVAPTDYIPDLSLDPARLRLNWQTIPRFMQHLQVTFVAGYGDEPTFIPAPIQIAVKMLVAHLYEHRGDGDSEMPKSIEWLLTPYKVMFFGG